MNLADFDYELPEDRIALHPPAERGASRLLVLDKSSGSMQDKKYAQLDQLLHKGDVLVINNTRVLPARLIAQTQSGVERELLLLEKHGRTTDHHTSLLMYRRKISQGQMLTVGEVELKVDEVYENGTAKVSSEQDLWEVAEQAGHVPLPPYMHRDDSPEDRVRYQTVFAKEKGSVAAPTASLNLTDELLQRIKEKGVEIVEITLHVGIGTFMPIRVDDVTKHKMHQEYFEIPASTAQQIRNAKNQGNRVVAVGTTVTRTLEYAAQDLLNGANDIAGEADIFIYPSYAFKVVDAMVTNFHAPHSTVLMMAAAFAGWDKLHAAYMYAIDNGYAFLSYGDSMFIE